jgi:hypothetical protein
MAGFKARVVLLGASNLTRGLPIVIETCRALLGAPLDVQLVTGHGRSYGMESFVVVRSLPSIRNSSLWPFLQQAPPLPTYGLIADVGNDIMYGIDPDVIASWVGSCIEQLSDHRARLVMTSLPIERLRRMSPVNFLVARSIFFPGRRMSMADAMGRAQRLDQCLRDVANRHLVPVVDFPYRWYGWDPIHMPRAHWPEAWGTALAHWIDPGERTSVRVSVPIARELQLRLGAPDRWWLFGQIPCGRAQPWLRLRDGTAISMR